jgi:GTP diphosphokinase / guanosine-3',5'-bis(diphosphate) 3'-diphosphatase
MSDKARILKALDFASGRHRTQFRKGEEKTPYINHPIRVTHLLANVGEENDTDLLIAAILHDVLEDTVSNPEEKAELAVQISQLFGEEVLSIVDEVTDDKSLDKAERKRLQIIQAPHKSEKAKKLKIADKIANVYDITFSPPKDWTLERRIIYLDWAEQVVAGLRGVNKKLEDLFDEILAKGRSKLSQKG